MTHNIIPCHDDLADCHNAAYQQIAQFEAEQKKISQSDKRLNHSLYQKQGLRHHHLPQQHLRMWLHGTLMHHEP